MDDFARGTRGLWSKASLKADAAWGPRRQAESVALRRSKLAEKVKELKTRTACFLSVLLFALLPFGVFSALTSALTLACLLQNGSIV